MRMTIGMKLILGFIGIALLVLVVGVYGLNASKQIVKSFEGGEEHFRAIVSAATEVSSHAKRAESHLILFLMLNDEVDREKFLTIKSSLIEQIEILDDSVKVPEARVILDKIKFEKDELVVTSKSLLEIYDNDSGSTVSFKPKEHEELIKRFHEAASSVRKYGVELAEFETDFLNKQAAIASATEVSSYAKRAEGHLMLFLMLHDEVDREKFFMRHAYLLEQIEILDKRVKNPEARIIFNEIKSKADELLIAGTSLLDAYDEDMERTGVFDLEKHQELLLGLYSVSSDIHGSGVELAKFNVGLEAEAKETALQNAVGTQRNMLMVMIFAIIVAFFLAYFISRTISKPIKELSAIAIEVGKGDFTKKAQIKAKDEIGELASSFNQMTDEISKRNKQLEITNETLRKIQNELEIRVEKRTAELAKANQELQEEIAERKQVEVEREHLLKELQDKTKELEQIVYVASHDLRSPLVNIQGFTEELRQSLEELRAIINNGNIPPGEKKRMVVLFDEDILDDLKYILSSTSKIDSLLSGLLRLSRLGRAALDIKNINMNELLTEISESFEFNIKNADIKLEIDDLPNCSGDRMQINQVFSNLIGNAIKYRDPKRPGLIKVNGRNENGQVIFSVEDNGIGIAPENQQRVFEIFQRLEPDVNPGEGLGLTIVRKILDRHAGKVWLESDLGIGSKFYVSLPADNNH